MAGFVRAIAKGPGAEPQTAPTVTNGGESSPLDPGTLAKVLSGEIGGI